MDWEKAERRIKKYRKMYEDISDGSGFLGLQFVINPLIVRFQSGERTQELYDAIYNVE